MVTIETGIITLKNYKEDLVDFGQFDIDANGANGEEYLEDEAKELGFETNLDYWADLAEKIFNMKEGSDIEKLNTALEYFLEKFSGSYHACYEHIGYKINELDEDKLQIIFAYAGEN